MSENQTYYLIDFENVNEAGLSNTGNLTKHDHIHIFSTKNAPKISIKTLAAFNDIDFNSHIIPAGNQSLDMHLIAYLGYLIGQNNTGNYKYVIVSKDTDYDNSISFLKQLTNSKICRQTSLCPNTKNNDNTPKKKSNSSESVIKSNLITKIQKSISNAGYDNTIANTVASIVSKYFGNEHFCNDVHNALRNTYSNYAELYKIIKPILKSGNTNIQTTAPNNTQLNNTIQKILSKASCDSNTISYVSSLVCQKHNAANAKQTIHSALVAKYGAGTGLNLYNHIKKYL